VPGIPQLHTRRSLVASCPMFGLIRRLWSVLHSCFSGGSRFACLVHTRVFTIFTLIQMNQTNSATASEFVVIDLNLCEHTLRN